MKERSVLGSDASTSWYHSAYLHLASAFERHLPSRQLVHPLSQWAQHVHKEQAPCISPCVHTHVGLKLGPSLEFYKTHFAYTTVLPCFVLFYMTIQSVVNFL